MPTPFRPLVHVGLVAAAALALGAGTAFAQEPAATTTVPVQAAPGAAATGTQTAPGAAAPAAPAKADRTRQALPAIVTFGAIAALLLVAGLVALAVSISRRRGRELRWAGRAGHTWREAGYRTRMAWADFRDWVRIGH